MACQKLNMCFTKFRPIWTLSCRYCTDFTPKDKWKAVPKDEVKRFIIDCMKKVGTKEAHATSLAGNLMTADYRGHYSHGLNRLGK
jgi:hypothetical protein